MIFRTTDYADKTDWSILIGVIRVIRG